MEVETVVTLLALYALFIFYRISKAPLHAYRTTLKFGAIKLLVFVSPVQRHILADVYGVAEGAWWQHVLTAAEAPLLAMLLWRAFPASELPATRPRDCSCSPGAERNADHDESERLCPSAEHAAS